ncbi:hypothetical protein ACNQFZ_18990 [Schinkia sp. CFF1]
MLEAADIALFMVKDIAQIIAGMALCVGFFSFLAYTYVNMLR